jgi:hypothetical protein
MEANTFARETKLESGRFASEKNQKESAHLVLRSDFCRHAEKFDFEGFG